MRFKKIYVEITNHCNLNCSFCKESNRPLGFISESNFEKIIIKIKDYTDYIYLHVLGEPLLHGNLYSLLDICKFYNIKVNITTNGILIKQHEDIKNNPALRMINFSIHSFSENKNPSSHYMNDILDFAISANNKTFIVLRFWNGQNFSKEDEFNFSFIRKYFGLSNDFVIAPNFSNGTKIAENIFLQQNVRFVWPDISNQKIFTHGKCYGLKSHIGILLDGSIVPCCLDASGAMTLGNIYESSLNEIINSDRANRIIEGFRKKEPVEALCKTCGYAKLLNENLGKNQ